MDQICTDIFNRLIDDVLLGVCFDAHRAVKLNLLFLNEPSPTDCKYELVEDPALDVFGFCHIKLSDAHCICPRCKTPYLARKFSVHFQDCFQGVKNRKSRVSKKEVADQKVETVNNESDNENASDSPQDDDKDNDSDWNGSSRQKPPKRKQKKGKNTTKKKEKPAVIGKPRGRTAGAKKKEKPLIKMKEENGEISLNEFLNMSPELRQQYLHLSCGAISEPMKRICANSVHCPEHSIEQKRHIRNAVLGSNYVLDCNDEINVDIIDDDIPLSRWDMTSRFPTSSSNNGSCTNSIWKKKVKKKSPPGSSILP